jgi:hypothetical protein
MTYEICISYEEFYPYFSVPQEDEYYKLEDIGQAADALYDEGARPFNVIDLELTELQKAQFNSLHIDICNTLVVDTRLDYANNIILASGDEFVNTNFSKHDTSLPIQEDMSFKTAINNFIKRLSSNNSLELIDEVSSSVFDLVYKVHSFLQYEESGVILRATSTNYNYPHQDWHSDEDEDYEREFFFLAPFMGLPTIYFVPSPEIYHEFCSTNLTDFLDKDSFNSVLNEYEGDHCLSKANQFSVPQGYATIHNGKNWHRTPGIGQARLLILVKGHEGFETL